MAAIGTTSACAENTPGDGGFRGFWGELPPRARRILDAAEIVPLVLGTTSACAENTSRPTPSGCPLGNYLRVRGEYIRFCNILNHIQELPPRARRILPITPRNRGGLGTTSACAENTVPRLEAPSADRNYLRVRGEYLRSLPEWKTPMELPPRARRIHDDLVDGAPRIGTTSACAENTIPPTIPTSTGWNYLRVRGEYPTGTWGMSSIGELPPRARRILRNAFTYSAWARTTSACAENTHHL